MRIAPVLLAGLGILGGTDAAVAGPIWIHYQIDSYAYPAPTGGGGYGNFDQHNAGQLSFDAPGTIARFSFLPSAPLPPADWNPNPGASEPYNGVTRFAVKVQLTDDASGEGGAVLLTGSATSSWTRLPTGEAVAGPAAFGFDDNPGMLTVGGHTFGVSATGGSSPNGGRVSAFITIGLENSNTLQTPEPATLALAGIGLAGAALRRRFRG